MEKKASYLSSLRFDKKLENSFISRYVSNVRLVILFVLLIVGIGSVSYANLPRLLNPEIELPLVLVSGVLPGASPSDVESLITVPIEDAVSGLPDVKTVTSSSRDSVSVTQIEFTSGTEVDKARSDVQSAVDTVELPDNVETPQVQALDFQNQPVWIFSVTAGEDRVSLNRFAKLLETRLENLTSVDRVVINGILEQEIQVTVSPDAITAYNLNPLLISQAIRSALSSYPAGTVKTDTGVYSLTIDPSVTTVEDIRNLPILSNQRTVALGDIATITERAKPGQNPSYFVTPDRTAEHSLTVNVYKTDASNINRAVSDADEEIQKIQEEFKGQFRVQSIINTGEMIDEQFSHLIRDFAITITLVVIALFVFLGVRQAFVAAFSAPLTFLITFTVMQLTGISLNFISFFALLLTLGLLVDDTIVVISAMTAYHRTGNFTPLQTGLLVWRDFVVAIFTTTVTTVWAFLPLLLASGIIGEFIKPIPIVVSTTLMASFVVAMLITLPVIIILLKPTLPHRVVLFLKVLLVVILLAIYVAIIPKGPFLLPAIGAMLLFLFVTQSVRLLLIERSKQFVRERKKTDPIIRNAPRFLDNGIIHFDRISRRYKSLIHAILTSQSARKRTILMVLIFSVFSYLLVPFGFVKNEFFPRADEETFYISLELPSGTNVETTEKEALVLLNDLRTVESLSYASADIGQGYSAEQGPSGSESNNILITVTLEKKRDKSSLTIVEELREKYQTYQKGTLSVFEQSAGPPAGSDLQIKLFGSDLTELNRYADRMQTHLESLDGVTNVNKSIKSGTSKLTFVPDDERLALAGITQDQVGLWLRFFASGLPGNELKMPEEDNESRDITLRMDSGIQTPEEITGIQIPTMTGVYSLAELGTIALEPNPTLITREEGKRTISVSAAVTQGFNIGDLNSKMETFADGGLALPEGYSWQTGGVNEENQNSVNSILQAMILSFLLIIVTMVLQFSSFRKALIVMLVIPLSISGVFIIFALTRTPLSFPALIGVLALFGIVVKNAILIVDKITQNMKEGIPFVDAIADGASSRLEAIALTTFCTILGLVPITLSDPLWRGLGGAIIAGLTFSGTIMLFFIPVVYYYWFHPGNMQSRK